MYDENREKGYALFESVVTVFLLLALVSGMYFLRINAVNRINCKASINADYIAQYHLDKIVYLNEFNAKHNVNAGGINYTVQENVKNIDTSENYTSNAIAEVTVFWKTGKEEKHIVLQRKWHR